MRKHLFIRWICAFFVIFFFNSLALSTTITDFRFWSAPDHTRIVLDLSGPIKYQIISQESPLQYHLQLSSITSFPPKREIEINDPFVAKMSLIDLGKGNIKLVLYQKKHLSVHSFILKPYLNKPYRLVIDLVDLNQEKKDQEYRQRQKEIQPRGTKIVVIDPGHGGEDSGAIGPQKTMEKDIVLKVGVSLVSLLNEQRGIKAFLTRKGDYFIPLEQRVKIAREYKADLLISLHTDGSFNSKARGSSVYCLSLSGATNQAAKLLADKENMSNILGGVFLRPASLSPDPNVNQILLDLLQNRSMKESFRFAEIVLEEIKSINSLNYPTYRQANFIVLRAPDIPSVLIELAYITNKEDERLLNSQKFQEKIVKALGKAIQKYFNP
ncbi:MAG: N-acetylmuramoyl-L-alanine amidase [Thermodesulfobacteriota bacterium]